MKVKEIALRSLLATAEILIIFFIGLLIKVPLNVNILITGLFCIIKMLCNKGKHNMHYASWYRCIIWSVLTFLSLYLLSSLDIISIIILTILTAILSTDFTNINETLQWKGKESKYQDIMDYIKYNPLADDLLDFEKKLKEKDTKLYMLYKYRFKDGKSFSEISNIMDIETNRITELLEKIAFAIRMTCKI